MSKLKFDGSRHCITLTNYADKVIGAWVAYNNVDSHAKLRYIFNGTYLIQDKIVPHYHMPSANGPYGLHGIIRFYVSGHTGIGVHSGRAGARHLPGPQHPTMGCIRTSDEAMSIIKVVMQRDPLAIIEVANNGAVAAHIASIQNRFINL